MSRELDAYMDGSLIGRFRMSGGGAVSFEYVDGLDPESPDLSLSMQKPEIEHRGGPPLAWLDGLLPDNPNARDALARRFQVSAKSPFRLLEHNGRDVAGAMQLIPPGERPDDDPSLPPSGTPATDEMIEAALRGVLATYGTGAPPPEDALRLSLAGAQPKIALAFGDDGWYFPARGVPSTHIVKPELDVNQYIDSIDIAERLTMTAAKHLGLSVANTEPWESPSGDLRALVVHRYDRRAVDGRVHRLHQEDLLQALGLPPSKKYQQKDGGPGIAAISNLFRNRLERGDRIAASRAFFAGVTFNLAVIGTDAHAKNYSLLLLGDHVEMAPLYDLVSLAGYDVPDRFPEAAMSVGGEYAMHSINAAGLAAEAGKLDIDEGEAHELIQGIVEPLPDAFVSAAAELKRQGIEHPLIGRTIDGIVQKSTILKTLGGVPRTSIRQRGSSAPRVRMPAGTPAGGQWGAKPRDGD